MEQFFGVARFYAAAIEDGNAVGRRLVVFSGKYGADMRVHFLGLGDGSRFAGADGPDGFISDDDLSYLGFGEMKKGFFHLGLYKSFMCANFPVSHACNSAV